jgi:hypothetical protein
MYPNTNQNSTISNTFIKFIQKLIHYYVDLIDAV